MGIATIKRAVPLAILPMLISGCDLLAAAFYPEFDPFAPDPFGGPGIGVMYEVGTATIEIDQGEDHQTIVLNEVVEGSERWEFGATVTWRNDDGWAMTISSYTDPSFPAGDSSDVMLQRISGTELWMTDYLDSHGRCIIQLSGARNDRLKGLADCDGLRWTDGLGAPSLSGTPRYVEGQDNFHIHVEFEAAPDETISS